MTLELALFITITVSSIILIVDAIAGGNDYT